MNHLYIPHTDRSIYLPASLAECDKVQYIEMAALILQYQTGQISYNDLRVHAVYKLLNLKRTGKGIDDTNKFSNIFQISQLIDSFFEKNEEGVRVIKQDYIHNPVPSFRGAMRVYHGPSDEFNNVTFGEYVDGLNHFIDFHDTGEFKYLELLMATFYRKKRSGIFWEKLKDKFNGDVRVPYNSASVAGRADKFRVQHPGIVYGFYLLFASFQKYLATSAKLYIQGKEIDLSVLFEDSPAKFKESDLPGLGMRSLVYSFAESGAFGTLNQVKDLPLWEAFVRMYDLTKKNKDYEANQPS